MRRLSLVFAALVVMGSAGPASLKDVAPRTVLIGAALNGRQIAGGDQVSLDIVTRQFSSISPENVLKWGPVHPEADRWASSRPTGTSRLARNTGLLSSATRWCGTSRRRGGSSTGKAGERADKQALLARMRSHIETARRALPRPRPRVGRRQRSARRRRDAAQDAVARGDRPRIHRQGVRIRPRGGPRRGAVLQRLQPLEAGQACGGHPPRQGTESQGPACRRDRRASALGHRGAPARGHRRGDRRDRGRHRRQGHADGARR